MVESVTNSSQSDRYGCLGPLLRRGAGLLWLLVLSGLVSCADQTISKGGVIVPFVLGNMRTCKDMGIDVVRGVLDDGYRIEEVPCVEGQIRFSDLPEGYYRIALYGLSEDSFSVMDSLGSRDSIVEVPGQGVSATLGQPVLLTAAPAFLQIRWRFGFSSCEAAGVQEFLIRAWNSDGRDLLLETMLPCDSAGMGSQQYRDVPDVDRDLGGTLVGQVSVTPLREDGTSFGPVVGFQFDPPGSGRRIQLTLDCDRSGCEAVKDADD